MTEKISSRKIKKIILGLLREQSFDNSLKEILDMPPKKVIGPLFAHFYHKEEIVRWRAVTAMGVVVSGLAESGYMEEARIVMRRLMWNLNDESGGIGWGSPEAMGEITARNADLAKEFHYILTSYANEHGNFLEHEILQRGVLWGIGRLANVRPDLIQYAACYLVPFMKSSDPFHRGLAVWGARALDNKITKPLIKELANDNSKIKIFMNGQLIEITVGFLASKS